MSIVKHEIIEKSIGIEAKLELFDYASSDMAPHWHQWFEVIYMLEGEAEVTVENTKHILHCGELLIINTNVIHATKSGKDRGLLLQFPPEIMEQFISDHTRIRFKLDPVRKAGSFLVLKKLLYQMYEVYTERSFAYLAHFQSLFYEFLYILLRDFSVKLNQKEICHYNKDLEKLNGVMQILCENYNKQINVKDVAEQVGYHVDYISKIFKQYMGMTMTEYIYKLRIIAVYDDLLKTEFPIYEIFEKHGCSNHRVAMREFKKYYKCTPREVRKMKK